MAGMFSKALSSFTSNIGSNYKLNESPISFAGPWKIFDAKHKASGKAVSIFVFEKRTLESNGSSSGFGSRTTGSSLKRAQEEVVERLRREASSLARLRHPSILELVEPVEDTRSGGLQFATEAVTGSLASLLVNDRDNEAIDELDIQKGLLQVGKGLEFLHESAGLIHANLTPEAVVINYKSDWKITGLGFSGKHAGTTVATSAPEISLHEILNFDSRLPRSVQLNFDFTSPDFAIDNNASPAADMFSLGMLIISLYNSGRSPLSTHESLSSYKRLFSSSSTIPTASNNFLISAKLSSTLQASLARLITRRPAQRLNAKEFQQAEYFDNILVSTIRFLESLPAKTQNEKSQFLRGLPRIMPQFSSKVLGRKVLPALLEEMKDRALISLILQNVFKMLNALPSAKRVFAEKVIPKLREVFITPPTGKKDATVELDSSKEAGLMVLLENIKLISENTTGKEFKDGKCGLSRRAGN
jgi:SCY1-like protein 2